MAASDERWSFSTAQISILLAVVLNLILTAFWAGRTDAHLQDLTDRVAHVEQLFDGKFLRTP